ncbi:MAG: isoleucine--tRNA ligase [Treponema sp.]|nr:isoleucine--tRNA ligase [Treponema sp.]
MYTPVNPKANFPKMEEDVLAFWQKNDTFKKSIQNRNGAEEYVFYDGPPFATGLPHFGHFIPSTIKDIIPRYHTMKGKKVERRFGWDCHGLPVENLIEKELGINSKHEIESYGVEKFNDACRASVLRYTKEWRKTITRMGRWVDFDNDYKTMAPDYMESIWWVVKALWDKNMIYEGNYILPYCPRCATVLSNHELSLGYRDVTDPAITVRFKATRAPEKLADEDFANGNTYFLAWTTTPWTLPSNEGLCMGSDIDYVKVRDNESGDCYILARARLGAYYKNEGDYTIIYTKKGRDFLGATYEPLFPYFAHFAVKEDGSDGAFRIFNGDFVSTEDGTGIVHAAPGFGEDDSKVFAGTGIPTALPVDAECKFTKEVPDYEGRFVKDCDKDIIARLKAEGKLVKREQIVHSYPHCWRCDSPLIYRGIGSWFVKVANERERLLQANAHIAWQPAHIKEGRFGKWLAGARDWAISRNRFWGNPIPIWKCDECGETLCIGSREELKKFAGVYPEDLHKQFVDKITMPCTKCGKTMHRIPEVLDCWFESGSMPYAQNHYPFENKAYFENHFPADFISEGLDQTRGWFYTLTVLAAELFNRPAFKNCIVNGLVLASDGRKMSKSLRNYTDPEEAISQFGADAIRLFLVHSAVVKADDLRYSDDGVRDVLKGIIIPLWNSYSFFVQYANIDGIAPCGTEFDAALPQNPLDLWLLSITQRMVQDVSTSLDAYDLSGAIDPIVIFIEELNNWYIRRSRRRFWKSENDTDKTDAYSALYSALKTFALVAAPVIPFITETIWQNLRTEKDAESVHLAEYPVANKAWRNESLEFKMNTVQKAVSMGHALRNQFNIKNRQPLESVAFVTRNVEEKNVLAEMEDVIREELNVKKVIFHEREDELVEYRAKANFRVLGKKIGSLMKSASAKIETLESDAIQTILDGSNLTIDIEGTSIDLDSATVNVERIEKENLKVLNDGTLTVGLDTKITDELKKEGYVRDLVRGIQNLRKESGLHVTDRISLMLSGDEELKAASTQFSDFIANETLATSCSWEENLFGAEIEADNKTWRVKIEKA